MSPKVASVLMGHATPALQAGAAHITLARYTHALAEGERGLCFVRAREGDAIVLTAYGLSSGFWLMPIAG